MDLLNYLFFVAAGDFGEAGRAGGLLILSACGHIA